MNYNPYAAPQAPLAVPATGAPYGQPQAWNTSEVISLAWARFKEHGGVLVLSYFLASVISGAVGQVPTVVTLVGAGAARGAGADFTVVDLGIRGAGIVASQVIAAFFQVGLLRIWLAIARGQTPEFGRLFSGADKFLPLLGLNLLMMLILGLGMLLLIVPGVILYLGLFAAQFYVVDADMGPIQAMKASWSATRGQKGEIFLLALTGAGLGLLGLLMCCIGTLGTVPLYLLATAIAFTRLSGIGPAPGQVAGPAYGPPYGPPPAPYA